MITWNKGVSLPESLQEVSLGIIDNYLIYSCGFCAGYPTKIDIKKQLINKKSKYIRGFKNSTYAINLTELDKWIKLPDFPGESRECMRTCQINNKIYFMGGFSYKPSINANISAKVKKRNLKSHIDCYILEYIDNKFIWNKFIDLPFELTNFSICSSNNKIYLLGGGLASDNTWLTEVIDIKNEIYNEYLYVLDLDKENLGWEKLSKFIGTPRINANMNIINEYIYIIGGIKPNQYWKGEDENIVTRYYHISDNWKYNINDDTWYEINNSILKFSNNGSSINNIYSNRYILIIGGNCNNKNISASYSNEITIYDSMTDKTYYQKFITDITGLCYTINNNKIYVLAGEKGSIFTFQNEKFGGHPDLFFVGTIDESLFKY